MSPLNNKGALRFKQRQAKGKASSRRLVCYSFPLPPVSLHHVFKHFGGLP